MTNPLLSDFWPAQPPPPAPPKKEPPKVRHGLVMTVAYVTCRMKPRFDWFAHSLAHEMRTTPGIKPENIQVLIIDSRLWYEEHRRQDFLDIVGGRFQFDHHPPKPSAWQGPQRQTSVDYFCAVNARNSALAYTKANHVAFADDVGVLLPGWLRAHLAAMDGHYALVGTTSKVRNLEVNEEGEVTSYRTSPGGEDTRIPQIHQPLQKCSGLWLYGGTFSTPMKYALAVNGKDECYMGINGADYDFGLRLERAGAPFYTTKSCARYESKDDVEPRAQHCNKAWAGSDGPQVNNYLINDLKRTARSWTRGNDYVLRDVRHRVLEMGEAGFPAVQPNTRHWVDKQLLSEM